jgi:hypothetical protein
MRGRRPDAEKEQYWRKTIRQAARSGMSVRRYCQLHRLSESQFHWWQRKLEERHRYGKRGRKGGAAQASFALVSDDPDGIDAGIELILGNGHRLRIGKGIDETIVRAVLAAMEPGVLLEGSI